MAEAAERRAKAPPNARAQRIIAVWNDRARRGQPAEYFPTFATAIATHCWRVTYCCPACRQTGAVDLRDYVDAHHRCAPIPVLIHKLSCVRCCPNPPLAVLLELECPAEDFPVALAPAAPMREPAKRTPREDKPQNPVVNKSPDRPRPGANIASCRKLGVTQLTIYCTNSTAYCSHQGVMLIANLPDELLLDEIERRCRCERCGAMTADVRLDYSTLTPGPSGGGPKYS